MPCILAENQYSRSHWKYNEHQVYIPFIFSKKHVNTGLIAFKLQNSYEIIMASDKIPQKKLTLIKGTNIIKRMETSEIREYIMNKTSKKGTQGVNGKKNAVRPYTVMCTDIYLLLILIVFPLYFADGYFHLPEKKAMFWTVSTLIYVLVCAVGVIIMAFSMREHWNMENFKKSVTMTDACMFGFLISNLIALAMSNDTMGSWVGAGSRYYGARVLILVCVSYFLISRYAWLNKVFIVAFLIGGNGVCLLATFDYFGMDVLGINQQMQQTDWLIFISTIGNANTCASYVCMALAGAMVFFCIEKGLKLKIFAGISIMNCAAALVTSRSDSAFAGIAVMIVVLAVLAITSKIDMKDYILMLALIDAGLLVLFILRKLFIKHLILESFDSGLPSALNQPLLLGIILIVMLLAYGAVRYTAQKHIKVSKNAKIVLAVIIGIIIAVFTIIFANRLGIADIFKSGMGISENTVTGSRSYIYERTLQAYGKLPFRNKVFGCGQASILGVLNKYFGEELSAAGIGINSAHNNILDYLIITGLLGVVCYLGTVVCSIKHAFQTLKDNESALIFGGIVIAYFAQGLFNIDQAITTPVFWLMVACCEAMYRRNILKKEI